MLDMLKMRKQVVKRDGAGDLKFRGELLARVDRGFYSFLGIKTPREMVEIYRTSQGGYVVATYKRHTYNHAYECATPEEVVRVLEGEHEDRRLSALDKEALAEAAKKDKAFRGLADEDT